jgi:hypothetical protein
MPNDIIKADNTQSLNAYLKSTTAMQYLSFKQGIYATKDQEFPLKTRFRAERKSHEVGWQLWGPDGRPETLAMGRIHDGYIAPSRNDMGYLDKSLWDVSKLDGKPRDPVQPVDRMTFIAEDNAKYIFSTSSWGGRVGLGKLEQDVLDDGGQRDAIIELSLDRVKNSFGGYNFQPRFPVVDWVGDMPPEPAALPVKKSASEIVGDSVNDTSPAPVPARDETIGQVKPHKRVGADSNPNDDFPSNLK